jgi:GNAT superfamily N-acetyltransferase
MASPEEPQPATIEDLIAIRGEQRAFWGERDLSAIHHPLLVHEFGSGALVIRAPGGLVLAYLFGLLTPERVGYIHLVAVRDGHRGEGLGRTLYAAFERIAREHGARALKAFTQPSNTGSIAFHTALAFTATETPGYVGPGETRTVFWRELG